MPLTRLEPVPGSHTFISQRLRLHYVDWGNREAPPVVLVHGGRDHCRNWDWVAARLCADHHVLAPDLRGHGDSAWSADGNYSPLAYVVDLLQLICQQASGPVDLVGHSLGGNIALRFAALYPEWVRKTVAIEGLGPSPELLARRDGQPIGARLRSWIDDKRALVQRTPRRWHSLDAALARMREAHPQLSANQARHLTVHGVNQNEDGTFSWKFDNDLRVPPPIDVTTAEEHALWSRIACPTLLVYGAQSWASNPAVDGRALHFRHARVALIAGAGHWVHHDRLDEFTSTLHEFLA